MDERKLGEIESIHPNRRLWRDVLTGTGSDRGGNPWPQYTDGQLKALGRVIVETSKEVDQASWPNWVQSYVSGGVSLEELLKDVISEVEKRAKIALETEIASEKEFPIAKLLSPEEAKQVLESGRQSFLADKETVSPVSPEEARKLLETSQQVEYLGRGQLSVVYSFPNIPGWVVKLPLRRNTVKDNLRFSQEEKLLARIAAREQETGRPRTCPNVLPGYASGEKTLRLVNKFGVASTKDIAVVMEQVQDGQRHRRLELYCDSTVEDERGIMQTAIRQLLLHGLTLVELGKCEKDRTAIDYFWDRQEGHIIVLDYNVIEESPDVARLNKSQVGKSGSMITELAGSIRLILIQDAKNAETALKTLEEQILLVGKAIDKPTLEFALRCFYFYNDVIPGYQTVEQAIQAYDRILTANAVPNDRRDQEIGLSLQRGDTRDAYNIAYYSTDEHRQERLSLVLKAAGGKSPYQLIKEAFLVKINLSEAGKNDIDPVNAGTVPNFIIDRLRIGSWDKVAGDPEFTRFRETPLEKIIELMRTTKENDESSQRDWLDRDGLLENFLEDKTNRQQIIVIGLKLLKKIPLADYDFKFLEQVKGKLTEDMSKHPDNGTLKAKLKIVNQMLKKPRKQK